MRSSGQERAGRKVENVIVCWLRYHSQMIVQPAPAVSEYQMNTLAVSLW